MLSRTNTNRCLVAVGALMLGGVLLAGAAPARAQSTGLDPRWQPWLGCWEPVSASGRAVAGRVVCVMPAAGTSAVDLATVDDGKILSREHIDATGEHQAVAEDGCTGWRSARWSAKSRRVYLHSRYTCPGGVERESSGILAISPEGQMLDIRGVTAGAGAGVRILRYREAPASKTLPSVAALLQDRTLSVSTARTAAEAPVSPADVVEASKQLDSTVVQAWLVARNQGFDVDGRELVKLADAGVSGSVIDAMVALSYPKVFAINPATRAGELRPAADQGQVAQGYNDYGYPTSVVVLDPYYYGYGLSPFGYSAFGYSPFGYAPFGFGYGWYSGRTPIVIVRTSDGGDLSPSHGKVVKGRGYSRGARSGTGGSATPTHRVARPRSVSPSGYSGGASAAQHGGSSGSSTTRTAHPRRP